MWIILTNMAAFTCWGCRNTERTRYCAPEASLRSQWLSPSPVSSQVRPSVYARVLTASSCKDPSYRIRVHPQHFIFPQLPLGRPIYQCSHALGFWREFGIGTWGHIGQPTARANLAPCSQPRSLFTLQRGHRPRASLNLKHLPRNNK